VNLILDIGNTVMKFALFQGQTLLVKGAGDWQDLAQFIEGKVLNGCLVSTVTNESLNELTSLVSCDVTELTYKTSIPIVNSYTTPSTLGNDRLANAVGGLFLRPDENTLVVDCGTCIKFDFVSHQGKYVGGSISPGLLMRFKALNEFTGLLPLLEPSSNPKLIGDSTYSAINSGVVNGVVAEIDGLIANYRLVYENLTVILTGGDASFFDKELKSNIFVEPNLTLIGLNEILRHNISH
jgi:type III pantothenate kinase